MLFQGFWLVSIVTHESVTYGGKAYPGWSIVIGWVMAVIVLSPIPIFIVLTLRRHTGTFIQVHVNMKTDLFYK